LEWTTKFPFVGLWQQPGHRPIGHVTRVTGWVQCRTLAHRWGQRAQQLWSTCRRGQNPFSANCSTRFSGGPFLSFSKHCPYCSLIILRTLSLLWRVINLTVGHKFHKIFEPQIAYLLLSLENGNKQTSQSITPEPHVISIQQVCLREGSRHEEHYESTLVLTLKPKSIDVSAAWC
jgi:hypothetical protein